VVIPKAICDAINQIQSIRALSAGLISLKVAQINADHKTGEMKLPQKAARRDGSIGSNTANSRPTRIENTPWLIKPTIKPVPLKAVNCARSARAREGTAAAASRLIGYQMLRCAMTPYTQATTAIAMPPAIPPLIPDETGGIAAGLHTR